MPKLDKKAQKAVDAADENVGGGFEPLPAGKYIGTLKEVEAGVSSNGNPTWNAQFEDIVDLEGNEQPGRQFLNLTLVGDRNMPDGYTKPPRSRAKTDEDAWKSRCDFLDGKVKQFFYAFGYSVDSDTDEMIGDRAVLTLGVETINQGNRKGELTNRVNKLEPLDSVEFADAGTNGPDDDDF